MAQECITIKGTLNGLMIILDASRDLSELRGKLAAKFDAANGFFEGAPFALVPSSPLNNHETKELEAVCRKYGLVPKPGITPTVYKKAPRFTEKINATAVENKPVELPTLLKEGNLRNGQVIQSEGHVMFIGDVNQGAVIKAVGHIMVMGNLMGSAYAGINGNTEAVIIAHRMRPEQLRIGPMIARSPKQMGQPSYPEIAKLINSKIIIEPYMKVNEA